MFIYLRAFCSHGHTHFKVATMLDYFLPFIIEDIDGTIIALIHVSNDAQCATIL